MKKLVELLTSELEAAFEKAGYDKQYARVTLSNRPDLCEYQCNGAMAAAKAYRKAPIMIANDVVAALEGSLCVEKVDAVNPGFINITLDAAFVAEYLGMKQPQYSRYERGLRDIPTDVLIRLARLYKTSTDYILGLTTKKDRLPE